MVILQSFPPPSKEKQYRNWFFTLNNWTDQEYQDIKTLLLRNKGSKWIICKEVGKECGTHHLHGSLVFKSGKKFSTLKKVMPRANLEITRSIAHADDYVLKDGDIEYSEGWEPAQKSAEQEYLEYMTNLYSDVKWQDWQQNILNVIASKPSRRDVYWIWEDTGNVGKSFLSSYIDWKHKCIIVNGKQDNIFNGIKSFLDTEKVQPKCIIVDIPRTNEKYVCYGAIEKIKDGLMYSGKYEGGKIRLVPTHLFVFSNFPPDRTKMSDDRFIEICLNKDESSLE